MEADLPLIGLVNERRRLLEALRTRNPLLMLGTRGFGKTKLTQSAIRKLPSSSDIIDVEYSSTLHELLISLARALLESGHHGIRKRAAAGPDVEIWLSRQTSVHLKGVRWNSLEADPRTIIFDGVDDSSYSIYRFLQRIYFTQATGIFPASRDVLALGVLGRLFWAPRRTLQLQPLSEADSHQLFHLAADRVGLRKRDLNLDEFRDKVLDAEAGNPWQIVEMCRFGANPQYVRR